MSIEMSRLIGTMSIVALLALVGLIPAAIASRKGRSFALWWLYGTVLVVVALPHAWRLKAGATVDGPLAMARWRQPCPRCGEELHPDAMMCRACQQPIARRKPARRPPLAPSRFKTRLEYERWKSKRQR